MPGDVDSIDRQAPVESGATRGTSIMRGKKKGFSDPELVTSKKSQSGLFWCLTPTLETAEIKFARPAVDLSNLSGTDISVTPGWQLSQDGETWPASTTNSGLFTGGVTTTETTTYPSAFEDISASMTQKYARFGVWVKNVSASPTTVETALAAIRLEFKKC